MNNMFVGKCWNCRTNISYQDGETQVKCPSCGGILAVANFLNEQIRIETIRKEKQEALHNLQKAEAEKNAAEQRLYQAITSLSSIETTQAEHISLLRKLQEGQALDKTQLDGLRQLAEGLLNSQNKSNDFISSLYKHIIEGQTTAENILSALQNVTNQLLSSHTNLGSKTEEIARYLKTDSEEKVKILDDLTSWLQNTHQEDKKRLDMIQSACNNLLLENLRREKNIKELQNESLKIQQAIDGFEKRLEEKELKKLVLLYHQAESCQYERRFDKAEELYRQVLGAGGDDPEVYWRIVMCHYCLEYREDNEGNRVPCILYPDLRDPSQIEDRKNLQKSIRTKEQQQYYNDLLSVIDGDLDEYRKLCKEVQFDVFISVKQKNKDCFTKDYGKARELYDYLTNSLKLKVFNSEITKPKGGVRFGPYILAALMSSKAMIVVGSCREFMDAGWVRDEWSRYLWLQKNEPHNKRILFCYLVGGMEPEQMPNELANIQAVADGVNAKDDLQNTLQDIIKKKPNPHPEITMQQLIDNGETWLMTGKFDLIKDTYNQLIYNGENRSILHLLSLCAEHKVPTIEKLPIYIPDLPNNNKFILAKKHADSSEEKKMIEHLLFVWQWRKERKKVSYISLISTLIICAVLAALYLVQPYADTTKRDIHIETIFIIGIAAVIFSFVAFLRKVNWVFLLPGSDEMGGPDKWNRIAGILHCFVCIFAVAGAFYNSEYAWDGWILGRWLAYFSNFISNRIEISALAATVAVSAISELFMLFQKNTENEFNRK